MDVGYLIQPTEGKLAVQLTHRVPVSKHGVEGCMKGGEIYESIHGGRARFGKAARSDETKKRQKKEHVEGECLKKRR